MPTPLQIAVQFLEDFGFFHVVLPFLLIFTLVFAVLEKTKILGSEDGKPKKNLDSMVAFAVALFAIAAGNVITVIREVLPMVVLVLLVLISFMLLVGSFMGSKEFSLEEHKTWKIFFMFATFIGIILIFLQAIKTDSGESWLSLILDYIGTNWLSGPLVAGTLFLVVIILVIIYVTGAFSGKEEGKR